MQARFRDAILAAAAERRPRAVAYVNLHSFKAFNVLVGHARGDAHLQRVLQGLERVGRAWRVAGDGFVVLGDGDGFVEQLRAFSWQQRMVIGATEVWSFDFDDGRSVPQIPWRSFAVDCAPRCGLVVVRDSDDVGSALELAEARCEEMRSAGAAAAAGFAPLGIGPWQDERRLAEETCPVCGAGKASLISEATDLGWAREGCSACGARYQRSDKLWVLGEEVDGGYM